MTPAEASPGGDADRAMLAEPARQSPVALVFIAWSFVRRLGISAIAAAVLFVVNGGLAAGLGLLAVLVSVGLVVFSALSWWRMTFCVVGDELVLTRGIASVERLVIPLERVQSVNIDQRLFHRPFGLVRASVDTAGSAEVEFEIDAIDRPRAEALRRIASDARGARAIAPGRHDASADAGRTVAPDEIVLRRSLPDLVKVGVTKFPWAGFVVFAPLIAVAAEFGAIDGLLEGAGDLADDAVTVGSGSVFAAALVVGGVVAAATVLGAAFQVVREIVTNWDLTLSRTPSGLRRTAGLLNTTSRSSTARRVQFLTTDDTTPQRRLGFTKVTLHTFGTGNLDLPGSTVAEFEAVRRLVVGETPPPPLDRRISRWSVFVAARAAAGGALVFAALLWFVVGWWSLVVFAAIPLAAIAADRRWRRRRWGIHTEGAGESYGLVWRHTGEVPLHKAQVVTVRQSFFERRRGLATLDVATAGGSFSIPFIELSDANAARDRVLYRAETDRRPVL